MPRPWLPLLKEKLTQDIRDGIKSRSDMLGKQMVKKTISKDGRKQVSPDIIVLGCFSKTGIVNQWLLPQK